MEAGRDLDVLVAEKVMGCKVELVKIGTVAGWDSEPHCCCPGNPHEFSDRDYEVVELKRYSTDIAAAWEVVEKITLGKERFSYECLWRDPNDGKWAFGSFDRDGSFFPMEKADTAPHAICLAALKAVGA